MLEATLPYHAGVDLEAMYLLGDFGVRVNFSDVKKGKHILELRAYGNRKNTFGQLHNCNENAFWCGPDAWRSRGVDWAYEYQLPRTGILVSPGIEVGGYGSRH